MADETRKAAASNPAGSVRGDGSSAPGAAELASETARKVWDDGKENVRSVVEERKQAAASGIEDFAGALRGAADSVDSPASAHMAESAADALDRISRTLRSEETGAMVRDLESMARRQPALFLGAAVAVGFVAVRFLKSSSEHRATSASRPAAPAREETIPAGTAFH